MAKAGTRNLDQKLAALSALRGRASLEPADIARVAAALDDESGVLVTPAVALVEQFELAQLYDRFAPAFTRLCTDGAKRDPLCLAKFAIAKALHAAERWEDAVFAAGVRYQQLEGRTEETAGPLRGICGISHAHFTRPDALDVLAELLADPSPAARTGAATGLADFRRDAGTAVLRLKLALGDADPEVFGACAAALIDLAGEDALRTCERFLAAHDDKAEAVALALGGSRLPEAFPILRAWASRAFGAQRHRVGFLALALLRLDAATDHLFGIVADGAPVDALAAAKALATFVADPALAARLAAAGRARPDKATRAAIADLAVC